MAALREILARFGVDFDAKNLAKADTSILGVVGKLQTLGGILVGGAVVRGIARFVGDFVQAGDALEESAAQLGISAHAMQAWQLAAKKSGIEGDALSLAFATVSRQAMAAADGTGKAGDLFKRLGVDIKDSSGQLKSADQLMREAGLGMSKLENSTERVAVSRELFGRAGMKLIPMFSDGRHALDKVLGFLDAMGGGIDTELLPSLAGAADALDNFEAATMSVKSSLIGAFLPIIKGAVNGISRLFAAFAKATKGTSIFQAAALLLGGALLKMGIAKYGAQFLKLAFTVGKTMLPFLLLVLLLDDLITMFRGGKSVIGDALDSIFGKGTAQTVITTLALLKTSLFGTVKDAAAADKALEKLLGPKEADLSWLEEVLSQVGSRMVGGIAQIGSDLGVFFDDIASRIKLWVKETALAAWEGAKGIGRAIINGIVDGLLDLVGIESAMGDAVDAAIKAGKDKARAHSPSDLSREELGEPLLAGMLAPLTELSGRMVGFGRQAQLAVRSTGSAGTVVNPIFQSTISLSVSGATPQAVASLRQGLREDLDANREATLAALRQVA